MLFPSVHRGGRSALVYFCFARRRRQSADLRYDPLHRKRSPCLLTRTKIATTLFSAWMNWTSSTGQYAQGGGGRRSVLPSHSQQFVYRIAAAASSVNTHSYVRTCLVAYAYSHCESLGSVHLLEIEGTHFVAIVYGRR